MEKADADSRPGYLFNRVAQLFRRSREARLREMGVGPGQVPVLMALRGGDALTQKALAALADVEQPSMAQTLARMERGGLVERAPDPKDGRSSLVRLTPAALANVPEVVEMLESTNARALAGFDDAERAALVALLRRVLANLEAGS